MKRGIAHHYLLSIARYSIRLSIEDYDLNSFIKREYLLGHTNRTERVEGSVEIILQEANLTYNLRSQKAKVLLSISIPSSSSIYFKEFLFQEFIELTLSHKNIVFMHGSSYMKDGKIKVFIGPSGSGKTTILSLLTPSQIISNDTVVIQKRNNEYIIYTSPFDRKYGVKMCTPTKSRSITIYSLVQGKSNKICETSLSSKVIALQNNLCYLRLASQIYISPSDLLKRHFMKVNKTILSLIKNLVIKELVFNKQLTSAIFETLE
jgi:hypothetical protein